MRERLRRTTETRRHGVTRFFFSVSLCLRVFLFASLILLVLFGNGCEKADRSAVPKVIKTKTGVEMVLIPAGWFEMGSEKDPSESPAHRVWVDAFLMDRYEVTQELYGKLILGNPSHFKGPQNPMEQMRWSDAALYCNARSREEGLDPCYDEETGECNFQANGYRLPTEAEWEYACRAGTKTDRFFGREERKLRSYAWYAENSLERTHPVGQKKPNAWGLYDIYGNVAEWCNDIYDENYYKQSPEKNPPGPVQGEKYVLRGGAWSSSADDCRSAYRVGENPGFQDACFARDGIGFRCVRNAPESGSASSQNSLSGLVLSAKSPLTPLYKGGEVESIYKGGNYPIQYQVSSIKYPASSIKHPESSIQQPESRTGFVYHDIYGKHDTGAGFPESPQRLTAIVSRLREKGLIGSSVRMITPESPADTREWITAIHTSEYVKRVRKSCEEGVKYLDSPDVPISSESYEVAVAAVGGVLYAIDEVMSGGIRNAFCAVRPPGHHALADKAMGFCIFNNVAIGARYIQKKYGLPKVLIVDWDVHHGNGTQDAFYDDPTVLYFSTHQYPFYPGTGSKEEKGSGKGSGYNINVPLPSGRGDEEYIKIFEEILKPAAMKYKPDFILISAGFDAHIDDPLGGMRITSDGFAKLTAIVKEIAEKCCEGRLVSVLEGGYDLDGLADSVEAHILVLQK